LIPDKTFYLTTEENIESSSNYITSESEYDDSEELDLEEIELEDEE